MSPGRKRDTRDASPWSRRYRTALFTITIGVLVCVAHAAHAATLFDPALRFRQLTTPHFVIYYHQGEDRLAARLAEIAEAVWTRMAGQLNVSPPLRTYVVLADSTDTPNGWATPHPYNLIVVTASAPSGAELIGNTSDWLRLVFTHEFTHIVHLDQSRGWARGLRSVFGRMPLAFPNLFLPLWQLEGLATYHEGTDAHDGRLHAAEVREIEGTMARQGRTVPMDRANGGVTAWPGAWAPYVQGVGFHRYLADRFGADRFGMLARQTAGRVPYLGSQSFKRVFGQPLGRLWGEYQRDVRTSAGRDEAPSPSARRLTHHGYITVGPRYVPGACVDCGTDIVYSVRNPHDFPSLMRLPPVGGPQTITQRYLGSTAAVGRGAVIFDQQELHRNAGLYSDLFQLHLQSGRAYRLTHGARVGDPDLSGDGRAIVAVRQDRGRRDLIVFDVTGTSGALDRQPLRLGAPRVVASEADTQFATPRWSPDGRLIAAERRRRGWRSEIVVVDPHSGSMRVVATGATRAVTPAWRPDGRALVAAADSADGAFRLHEFDVSAESPSPPRRLTSQYGVWPDVSADGRDLVYVGLTDDGFDLFSVRYQPEGSASLAEARDRAPAPAPIATPVSPTPTRDSRYAPWRPLRPTFWTPLITGERHGTRLGVSTYGNDPLGYHLYSGSASWLVTRTDAPGRPSRGEPDWAVGYAYDRWQPRFFASASLATSFVARASDLGGGLATLRERTDEAGMILPIRRVRSTQRLLVSGRREGGEIRSPRATEDFSRVGLRAGWALNTSQTYGYSISREDGLSLGLAVEASGPTLGTVGRAWTAKADTRAYLPGLARHHVVAVRVAAARATGPRSIRRAFSLGGSGGATDVLDLGSGAVGPMRGFPGDRVAEPNIAVLSADYRWPLARIERGVGTWPALLHTIHASLFADVGHAWVGDYRARDLRRSLGLELSANVVAGYTLPLTLTAGVAWRRDPSRIVDPGMATYVRLGTAF